MDRPRVYVTVFQSRHRSHRLSRFCLFVLRDAPKPTDDKMTDGRRAASVRDTRRCTGLVTQVAMECLAEISLALGKLYPVLQRVHHHLVKAVYAEHSKGTGMAFQASSYFTGLTRSPHSAGHPAAPFGSPPRAERTHGPNDQLTNVLF